MTRLEAFEAAEKIAERLFEVPLNGRGYPADGFRRRVTPEERVTEILRIATFLLGETEEP